MKDQTLSFEAWKAQQRVKDQALKRKRTRHWYYGAYGQYKTNLKGGTV